jgi:DNA-binding transcriptional LysR family regulator
MQIMNFRPNLRQIDAFLAVADLGSFSRAAERLGGSQPGISQAVRDLEQALGLALFHRTTRRVELTPEGAALRDRLSRGIEALEDAFAHARDLAGLRQGRLRVAAPPMLAATVLPPILTGFARAHPGLIIELADTVAADIPGLLRAGQADLGIGTFAATEPGLERRLLLRDAMTLFCPVDHPLSKGPVGWSDLAGVPLVALAPPSGLRALMDDGFRSAGLVAQPVCTVRQVSTALALVRAGLGVAVFPAYALRGHEGRLIAVPVDAPRLVREIVMIRPHDQIPPPAAMAFQRHLLRAFAGAYRQAGAAVGDGAVD